jgi:hypothetical protein
MIVPQPISTSTFLVPQKMLLWPDKLKKFKIKIKNINEI